MDAIPAGWPPAPRPPELRETALFPLPNVYLVPGAFLPLHVFEPRYRQMVEDSLDGPGRIVMGTVLAGYETELAGAPPVHHVAGLGEIVKHERLSDGRFLIVLFGLARVRIREVPSERLYRKVLPEPLAEIAPADGVLESLRADLERAILARNTDLLNVPKTLGLGNLADLLLMQLHLPASRMLPLYSDPDVARRATAALAEHALHPLMPPEGEAGSAREIL